MSYTELTNVELKRRCDHEAFTSTVDSPHSDLHQPRALEALEFGLDMDVPGYNVYALGETSTGMQATVQKHLQSLAENLPRGEDLLYVANFDKPAEPSSISLPAGVGRKVRNDISNLLATLSSTIKATFNSDEFRQQQQQLERGLAERQAQDTLELQEEARRLHVLMMPTPTGFAFAPERDGEVLDAEEIDKLSDEERKAITQAIDQMTEKLRERLQAYPGHQQELIRAQKALAEDAAKKVLATLTSQVRTQYSSYPGIIAHIDSISRHLVENIDKLLALGTGEQNQLALPGMAADPLSEYQVNLVVDRSDETTAPVVYESNPSLDNLVGKLEHRIEYGTPVTDFSLIRAGALHRANGGFLIIDVDRLLNKPFTWEALKRAMGDNCIHIESVNQLLSMSYSISLDPQPVPLNVKIVLLGSQLMYHLLRRYDNDFDNLFKILADFTDRMPWNDDNQNAYYQAVTEHVNSHKLRSLTGAAMGGVIEYASRLLADRKHLSTHTDEVFDLVSEANQYAEQDDLDLIDRAQIDKAVRKRLYRVDRVKELVLQNIERGLTVVATSGSRVGQINGLSVLQLGKLVFGQPSRITATARLGRGEVIDIERESKLGGNIHSKAVMIVSNFIGYRYAREQPLSLHASLVFEQSYGGIEGDSASIAEVCALLSAIVDEPLRQDIAVTGSMDQHGAVQAIGGVNEKIEGFFEVCASNGLTGSQGVLIPASNQDHLMLDDKVIAAVASGAFHIYTMSVVEDALALMFGTPKQPADVDELEVRIRARLKRLYDLWRDAQSPASGTATATEAS